ncbi:MAG: MFS transporter [Flavobacteriia bacterium]|jgi:FHS family L-fucose permease-like MFS transporter
MENKTNKSLMVITMVFFFWGFVAASNTVLIGLFKDNFSLTQFQSQLVDLAFYVAYFVGALIYYIFSNLFGDPINKIGYKKALVIGLLISALGALGFIPAANNHSFTLMLISLFVVGLGFAMQQIVANPYVIALGDPATGSNRVSLAGGINSLGTTIGPLLVNFAIFGSMTHAIKVGIESVKLPYLILSLAFVLVAIIITFSKLPKLSNDEKIEKGLGALKFPQLRWGMLAVFIYVGVEVAIQSNLPELMKQKNFLNLSPDKTVHFISLYWGSLMIGRWVGAISVFNVSKKVNSILTILVPLLAYMVILIVNWIKGSPIMDIVFFLPMVFILIIGFFYSKNKPAKTMILFGFLATIMMLLGLILEGKIALYMFVSGGLFCSIMWPCIFSLSIAGLGKYTSQGSSLLIMMILGGALIPPLQGWLADTMGSIHLSYIIPVLCFSILTIYAIRVKQLLKIQGINFEELDGQKINH